MFISGNTVESVRLHPYALISSLTTPLTGDTMVVTDECGSGHESAGEIVEVGEGVTQWKAGDRVAIEAGVPCASCDACRSGRYNACEFRS
jgi:threonine dehydrogenase-like Zn-dependent dehydrogenase